MYAYVAKFIFESNILTVNFTGSYKTESILKRFFTFKAIGRKVTIICLERGDNFMADFKNEIWLTKIHPKQSN